tara:strand:- start:954 stop:1172 length:219 start_codon:yes stop_codon:yes gene_type:complete
MTDKIKMEERLRWIEKSTKVFINKFDEIKEIFEIEFTVEVDNILNNILVACDLDDNEFEKQWRKKNNETNKS